MHGQDAGQESARSPPLHPDRYMFTTKTTQHNRSRGDLIIPRMRHNPGGYLRSVVAVAVVEYPEVPPALYARTRYVYDVLRANPVLWKEVAFAPTSAICTKLEQL